MPMVRTAGAVPPTPQSCNAGAYPVAKWLPARNRSYDGAMYYRPPGRPQLNESVTLTRMGGRVSEPSSYRHGAPRVVHKTERSQTDRLLQRVAELQTRVAEKAVATTIFADRLNDITAGLTRQVRIGCRLADTAANLHAARAQPSAATPVG